MRKTYPTDLSDAEWTRLRSYLPTPKAEGRPRTHSLRDVLDAIFYVLKSGCHWRLCPTTSLRGLPFITTSEGSDSWWTLWVFRSRFTSPRRRYKTGSGHSVFWAG